MTSAKNQNLHQVDWSELPAPVDDGGADHLQSTDIPDLCLPSTDGKAINLGLIQGTVVVFAYPMTGRPDRDLPADWDLIPGARGCTPQSCEFRDLNSELKQAGIDHLFGLSTQSSDYQKEAAMRLHLPFPLLSDEHLNFQKEMNLPVMSVEGSILLKRLTMIIVDGKIVKTFYPVFPPDQNAIDVLYWAQTKLRNT